MPFKVIITRDFEHMSAVGADIVTMSLGGLYSRALRAAVARAVARDMIVMEIMRSFAPAERDALL